MKYIILFIIVFYSNFAGAQHFYEFSYDDSGNRISREYQYYQLKNYEGNDSLENNGISDNFPETIISSVITESFGEHTVNIYPNPTNGILKIEVLNNENFNNTHFIIYDKQGKEIIKSNLNDAASEINLKPFATGNYILQLYVEGTKKSWVIVKF